MEFEGLSWQMYEYEHRHKTTDWYWSVGIVAVAVAVISIYPFNNILFAIVVIISAFTLAVHASKAPGLLEYHITPRSVVIEKQMYTYNSIESFWVEIHEHKPAKLILKSHKMFMPYIIMPLSDDVHPNEVRGLLLHYGIPEIEHHESLAQHILEYLGF